MEDKKISQLTELGLVDKINDSLLSVGSATNQNYKFLSYNMPLSLSEANSNFPFVFCVGSNVEPFNALNLTSIPSGFFENDPKNSYYIGTNVTGIEDNAFESLTNKISGDVVLTNNI